MGYKLATGVTAWAPVVRSHRAMVALYFMALTARDDASANVPAAHYWAGHRPIGAALGYIDPVRGEVEPSPSQLIEVGAVVRRLREAGAIELVDRATHGRAAVYRIIPRGPGKPSKAPP
jgi:hypothetical protein